MTSKERVLAAIEHKEPDVLPVGFKATDDVIGRLKAHMGVRDTLALLDGLPVDTYGNFNNVYAGVYPEYLGGPPMTLYPDAYPDSSWDTIWGYRRHWTEVTGGRNDELLLPPPLLHHDTVEDLRAHQWPQADWFDYTTIVRQCREAKEYAVVFCVGGFGTLGNLIGHERMYMDMHLNPEGLEFALDRLLEFYLDFADRVFTAAEGGIDLTVIKDDFGSQQGPLMSLDMFRRFWRPLLRQYFELAHRHGVRTMMHSCGAVFDFIPEFIEIGVDVLDPVQVSAAGMHPSRLKSEYGDHICFHGGIDTQQTLVSATPAELRRHIDTLAEALSGRGGFIIAPGHNIQGDVPMGNVLALFDHLRKLRGE